MPTALNRTVDNFVDVVFGNFEVFWADRTPVAWPNVQFDLTSKADNGWVKVDIQHLPESGGAANVSGDMYRREAFFTVQIFTRTGTGRGRADELAEAVLNWLETSAQDLNVWFRNQSLNEVGIEGAFYQVNCTALMTYDVIRS